MYCSENNKRHFSFNPGCKIETINCLRMHSGGKPPLDLLSGESKATQTVSAMFITLAFVPELERKHGVDTELGGIKLGLSWKPSP